MIDPGPDDIDHFEALVAAIADRPVSHIFVSHTHADHSPLARRLRDVTGAAIVGASEHRSARPLFIGEQNPLDAAADRDHAPDQVLTDGDEVNGDGWTLRTIETPGHSANHVVFELVGTGVLFSADHVMAWATTIVAPPDGAMRDYMNSLARLEDLPHDLYLPGHGGEVRNPKPFLRGLKAHRRMRERAILQRLEQGDTDIRTLVQNIYTDSDPRLHGAAGLSVLAHLEDLTDRGVVVTDGDPSITGRYTIA